MALFKSSKRKYFTWIPIIALVVAAICFATYFMLAIPKPNKDMKLGVTFSIKFAEELGIPWKEIYDAMLADLDVKYMRLPIYWSYIEPRPGVYNFNDFDYIIRRAEEEGVQVVAVVGRRQPRWPECHVPEWAQGNSESVQQINILTSIEATVNHYKNSPAIIAWQVDNEPLLGVFGECPPPDIKLLEKETAFVKSLDPSRPIMVTESGELSTWLRATPYADWIGVSMYRITWNQTFGYWYYPLSPKFYSRKADLVRPLVDRMVISELQAEPWFKQSFHITPLEEQYKSMNPELLKRNVDFASRTGFDESYLWGVEWWYWLKEKKNEPAMWLAAQEIFNN